MAGINRYSNIPLYCQLKNIILEKIESGEYKEDTKIPSEQELCEQYNISRPTVRQAINELTSNGYLYKLKGKGTFVARQKSCIIDIRNYTGFTDSVLDSPEPERKEIVSISTVTPREFAKLTEVFNLKSDNLQFTCIAYLNINNGEICSINVSYIPQNLFPNLEEDIRNKKPSYEILRGKYPLVPYTSKSTIEVSYADAMDASQLQVQPGQALIVVYNILYSKSGQPVEYIIAKYRADKCRLMFENHKL
ncbi:GntR family transcriptional regulator [Thermoclostridium stercorarium subsp. leptospartum DSM 9219]|uniref:GntR family transcriptional regulator n=1 Tax=Thermoclostridium stercorarium subsp. leptospartum DSM 9219 TaxID=1346611 RepID=A0A1B1YK78_THEST|nr:GntR family transcriptional regulator [Thermoclostridium stercorarium]ANX01190.1 GntR family transcriptional regulator [Thermoclostridium stercorarium subsp. leptospartum DSM 9219]